MITACWDQMGSHGLTWIPSNLRRCFAATTLPGRIVGYESIIPHCRSTSISRPVYSHYIKGCGRRKHGPSDQLRWMAALKTGKAVAACMLLLVLVLMMAAMLQQAAAGRANYRLLLTNTGEKISDCDSLCYSNRLLCEVICLQSCCFGH